MQILQDGGSSQEAVTCAISILEVRKRMKALVHNSFKFRIARILTVVMDQTLHYTVKLNVMQV